MVPGGAPGEAPGEVPGGAPKAELMFLHWYKCFWVFLLFARVVGRVKMKQIVEISLI